eukprot:CAMPEP_0116844284 /NCGR_PEP_ID=MMETSP0418-20121206/12578_1 /TAXON_ID=1158023 /ORGANISM="Astrosyne radiata, Strain 13vi08-1A" /LENGTH=193 /DNA_ID=CAMNT_0004475171 /DNA_START=96 /DNA_END=677 /DNA_ORIENTATION=-
MSHAPLATTYTIAASYLHWLAAVPMIASITAVLKAQEAPKEEKGQWMFRHKSMGLLATGMVVPRVGYRLFNMNKFAIKEVEGTMVEHVAAKIVHYGLYGFMIIMPATGVAMGYYGGKGLPFFFTTFPSIVNTSDEMKARSGAIAKQSFQIHKLVGTYGKYLVPLHVGGALQHYLRGHTIFTRVNPFRSVPPKM